MNKTNMSAAGFFVHTFMFEELGLGGGTLLVYAIIYSFTKVENGSFYGSNNYLVHSTGLSLGTVKNALSYLLNNGYIEKINRDGRRGYKTIEEKIMLCGNAKKAIGAKGSHNPSCAVQKNEASDSLAPVENASSSEGAYECAAKEQKTSVRSIKREPFDVGELEYQIIGNPRYEFHTVGRNELVSMTDEQYKSLLKLVDSEVLFVYLRRLELLIREKGYRTFSPYKTIKKWIKEDTAV